MDDSGIIALLQDGKVEQAFNAIVESYSERLYWHIRRFTCSHDDTDDVLQDVLLKVWAALPSFRGEARLFTWIYRIATNEALNFVRTARFKALLSRESLDSIMERKIDEDPHFDGDKMQRELMKAINRLPAKQRAVFSLRWFEELPYETISEITGTSVGALKASYHHAYEKIKAELEKIF